MIMMMMTLLERRMREDLIETFKIIYGIFNHGRLFFFFLNISARIKNLLSKLISKTKPIGFLLLLIKLITIFGTNSLTRSKTAIE